MMMFYEMIRNKFVDDACNVESFLVDEISLWIFLFSFHSIIIVIIIHSIDESQQKWSLCPINLNKIFG